MGRPVKKMKIVRMKIVTMKMMWTAGTFSMEEPDIHMSII